MSKPLSVLDTAHVVEKVRSPFQEALLRNSMFILLSTASMALFGFVFWLLVAHLYSPEQVGIASTLISSMNFITHASLLGVNSTFIRFLPKAQNRDEHINTGLVLITLAACAATISFVVIAPIVSPKLALLREHVMYSAAFVVLTVGATINLATDSIFIAYRRAGYNLLVDGIIGSSIQLMLPAALLVFGSFGIYTAQGAAAVVAMAASFVFLVRRFNYRPQVVVARIVIREIARYASSSYLAGIAAIVPTVVLPIIVLNQLGAAPAGYYYLASMMANLLFSIAYAIAQSLFAEGAYGERRLRTLTKRASLFLGAAMLPASIIFALVGPFILQLFGNSYGLHGRPTIVVFAAAGPFVAVSALGNVLLSITKQLKALVCVNVALACLTCGFALMTVHRGLAWVAGAWVVGYAVNALLAFMFLVRRYFQDDSSVRTPV